MEKLRGASLAKILRTLQLIHEEKQRRKSVFPEIVVNFVAQSDNYAELPELARLLAPLGIYFLGVNPLHHFFGTGAPTTTTTRSFVWAGRAAGVRGGRRGGARGSPKPRA